MMKLFRKTLALSFLTLSLLGCNATQQVALETESRTIAVEQNAEPAGGPSTSAVAHLLPATSPAYVTMTVTEVDKFEPSASRNVKGAITSGSGFVVNNSGYVMTAAHVAVNKGNIVAARAANGRIYSGKVIAIDKANDMAIIKLGGYAGKTVSPASPGCVAKGNTVFSLGKPHAQGDTVRIGALESQHFGRPVTYGKFGYSDALVLRMSTRKGESGGPLFDGNGKLIGMVVSTLSDQAGNSVNLAHAVPSNSLAKFLCATAECSPAWASLAGRNSDDCGGA
jgi:S1-C subfamily serine protease